MVSLGALAGRVGEVVLTVRYGGALRPGPVEREVMQAAAEGGRPTAPPTIQDDVLIEEVLVYSNRSPWYPQGGPDDYALADLSLDVPQGYNAIAGGTRQSARTEGGRTRIAYRQDRPGKYITVVIGRLSEVGRSFAWDTNPSRYLIHVSVKPRSGKTIIRVSEDLRSWATVMVIGITGAGMLGFAALGPAVSLVGGPLIGLAGTNALFRVFCRRRQRLLRNLAEALAAQIRESIQNAKG